MDNTAKLIIGGVRAGKSLLDIYAGLNLQPNDKSGKEMFYKIAPDCVCNGHIPNVFICCCGHDCSRCVTFLATINASGVLRQKSAEYYKSEFNMDIPAEKLRCFGGMSDEVMEACRECPFMLCCAEKGLMSCEMCGSYPCEALADYTRKFVNKVNQLEG